MGAIRPFPGVPQMETQEEEHDRTSILNEHRDIDWSPSMYRESAFPAMDVSREEFYRFRDMQSCMSVSEDCSMIDAPHAWRTSPADYSERNHYPHQRPHGLEIPKGKAPGEHWTSTERDTSCSGGESWTPHTSDSRSEADGTYNNQLSSPWNEETRRGLGICFAHAGGPPYLHDYSVSPQALQQYPENCTEDNRVKPELRGKEAGHTYYPENTGLCTPDHESIDYVPEDEHVGATAHKRASVGSVKDDDDESMDDDAEHDDDDEYTPATAGHGHGRGVARGSSTARKAGLASKRSQKSRGPALPAQNPNKVAKKTAKTQVPSPSFTRNHTPCTQCPSLFPSDSTLKKHVLSTHTRPFVCTFQRYGCNATVGSKNEWKRHINVQHLHLETWRCDLDACAFPVTPANDVSGQDKRKTGASSSAVSPSHGKKVSPSEVQYHDFDRKDLFTQHVKRMHAPPATASHASKAAFEAQIPAIQDRCHRQLRSPPPKSRCLYCPDKVFEGVGSWTDRLEHVGKHLEKNDVKKEDEVEDEDLRSWMMEHRFMEWKAHTGYKVINTDGKKKKNKAVATTSEGEEDAEGEDEEI